MTAKATARAAALELGPEVLRDWDRSSELEWLETNGLGGWASSTVTGANTRRYHGLLVAAVRPPVERWVLLSKLDETVGMGGQWYPLSTNQFPDVVHPRGFEHLVSFRRELFPVFEYQVGACTLRKTVAAIHDQSTTVIVYELDGRPREESLELELRPFFAGRHYHSLARANGDIRREAEHQDGVLRYQAYARTPPVYLSVPASSFEPGPDWYYHFELARERERGQDSVEDLFTPGVLRVRLEPGVRLGIVISTEPPAGRDAHTLLAGERRRRQGLLRRLPTEDPLCRTLVLAADQFVVRRGEDLHTVIAGYPWFTDWGRDTMIALPGLCLVTRRFEEARGILRAFAAATSQGMLPNRFQDQGEEPEYNTADASLWFFVAVHRYLEATGEEAFVRRELWPVLEEILGWHERGTRHLIHQTADGLLYAGEPGVQLTWMDAKVGDWVVTPRQGKPVEINALWYNALRILADLRRRFGQENEAGALEQRAEVAKRSFRARFWNREAGCLYDCIDDELSEGGAEVVRDPSLRPNQIFALSLPFPLVDADDARRVLETVEQRLLTPFGLRSLAPADPAYHGEYRGGPAERDAVYHQGTAWSWLLGPYITALVRFRGDAGRSQARAVLEAAAGHLSSACVGSISEVFDGAPPHRPGGCFAQAWSVAELLRAAIEDVGATTTGAQPGPTMPGRAKRPRTTKQSKKARRT